MPATSARTAMTQLGAALLLVLLTTLISGPAGAQTYGGGGSITAPPAAAPGEAITVTVSGFQPGSTVTFSLSTPNGPIVVGTAEADADGNATLTFTVPSGTEPGEHTIVASGTGADGTPLELSTTITIGAAGTTADAAAPAAGSTDDGSLALTGFDAADLLRGGALMVAAGAILVVAVRKRATAATVTSR